MRATNFLLRFLFICLSVLPVHTKIVAQPGTVGYRRDTATVNRFFREPYKTLNPDSLLVICDSLLRVCARTNYADGAFRLLIAKSIKYFEKENFEMERECSKQALPWAKRSTIKDAVAWCYNNIGDSYINEGNYLEASGNFYKALDDLDKNKVAPTHTTANIYANLGDVNMRLGLTNKAMAYFRQTESISRQYHLDYQLACILSYLGKHYNNINEPDSALVYFNEMMQIGKKMDKKDLQAEAYINIGRSLIVKGRYKDAIQQLQLAISRARGIYPYLIVEASYALGDALCHAGRNKEAEDILEAALAETKAHNLKNNYTECYTRLINLYKVTGNYKKALAYTDSMNVVKDSLTSTEKAKAIHQLEIKYQTAEKDKQIVQSELLIATQKSKLARKNIWIVSIAGSIVLLLMALTVLYRNGIHKQRLQSEQITSLQHQNTINTLQGVMKGEENERLRIARELHDGIGGILSAAMMRLRSLKYNRQDVTDEPAFGEAMELLDQMGDEVRKTAHNLMPEILMKQSLHDALLSYCNSIQQDNALHVAFQSYGVYDDITRDNKLNIYRIIQELLKNVIQHARASQVLVQVVMTGDTLNITVEDNGVGFEENSTQTGIGLHNLRTRVHSMDGRLTIDSTKNKGTTVYMEFDLKKAIA